MAKRASSQADDPGCFSCRSVLVMGRLFWAYKWDWLLAIGIMALGGLPQVLLTPNESVWSLEDYHLHALKNTGRSESLVPSLLLIGIIGVFPIALLLILNIPLLGRKFLNLRELHHALLGFFGALAYCVFVQGLLSVTTGGLRPDFYSVCQPDVSAWKPGSQPICTNPDKSAIEEGRRSFPCGHCSFSMGSMSVLSWYLIGLINPWDGRGHLWKIVCIMAPILAALLISVTRMTDGRHHGFDVFVGICIGALNGTLAYHQYFAWPFGPARGLPLCVRDTLGMPKALISNNVTRPRVPDTQGAPPAHDEGLSASHEEAPSGSREEALQQQQLLLLLQDSQRGAPSPSFVTEVV